MSILESVIATSPAHPTGDIVYVVQVTGPLELWPEDLAIVREGVAVTIVSSSAKRLSAAFLEGRVVEGPFAVIRLDISDSFAAPGFIAAATSACAVHGINVFVLSTFEYDFLLVAESALPAALHALNQAGFPTPAPQPETR